MEYNRDEFVQLNESKTIWWTSNQLLSLTYSKYLNISREFLFKWRAKLDLQNGSEVVCSIGLHSTKG